MIPTTSPRWTEIETFWTAQMCSSETIVECPDSTALIRRAGVSIAAVSRSRSVS